MLASIPCDMDGAIHLCRIMLQATHCKALDPQGTIVGPLNHEVGFGYRFVRL